MHQRLCVPDVENKMSLNLLKLFKITIYFINELIILNYSFNISFKISLKITLELLLNSMMVYG